MADKDTISSEPHELNRVVEAMANQGHVVHEWQVLQAIEEIGNKRELVYLYLKSKNYKL